MTASKVSAPGADTSLTALRRGIAFACILLPWLNPFANGPSAAVQPLLLSWMFASILLVVWTRGDDSTMAWAWLASALASAAIGLCQYFALEGRFDPWMSQAPVGEAFANLRQRNQFASLTSIGIIALVWLVSTRRITPAAATAAALLLVAGNAASASRTGFVQLLVIAALTLWWGKNRSARLHIAAGCAAVFAVYITIALTLPWLQETLSGMGGSSAILRMNEGRGCGSRAVLWSNVLHLIAQKPLAGWGWGELDYAHFITLYPGPRFCDILDNAHNLPLHLAVELGLPLALATCGVLAWATWRAAPWCDTDPARQMAWSVLAVILLHSMVEYPLWYGPFEIAAGLSVALLWRVGAARDAAPPRLRWRWVARCALAAAISGAVVVALWNYHRVSQLYVAYEERDEGLRDNTLEKLQGAMLFRDQAAFAELTTTALTRENAPHLYVLALSMLHFSPEPRVIEKLIASATQLGRDDEAVQYLARYRAAFPKEYRLWSARQAAP